MYYALEREAGKRNAVIAVDALGTGLAWPKLLWPPPGIVNTEVLGHDLFERDIGIFAINERRTRPRVVFIRVEA